MKHLKNTTLDEIESRLPLVKNIKDQFPIHMNEEVPIFVEDDGTEYVQLFDSDDEDHFLKLEKIT